MTEHTNREELRDRVSSAFFRASGGFQNIANTETDYVMALFDQQLAKVTLTKHQVESAYITSCVMSSHEQKMDVLTKELNAQLSTQKKGDRS